MYALDLQAHGVGYYAINECNPAKVGSVHNSDLREWIVASYLMSKQAASAVYISGVQVYGLLLPAWPEFAVKIGHPIAASSSSSSSSSRRRKSGGGGNAGVHGNVGDNAGSTNYPVYRHADGVWQRQNSNGVVFVNANAKGAGVARLISGQCYKNVAGITMAGTSIAMPPLTANILTYTPCS